MSYERKSNLFNSVKFRLTLVSGSVIALTTLAAFVLLYEYLGHALDAHTDRSLEDETREFKSIYANGGLDAMRKEISVEESAQGKDRIFILLFNDAGSTLLSSTLDHWGATAAIPSPFPTDISVPYFDSVSGPDPRSSIRRILTDVAPGVWVLMGTNDDYNDKVLATYRARCIEVFAVSLVVCLCGAWFIATRAMRGLDALTLTAEQIAGGELERRITALGFGNEIDRLAEVLNRMLAKISTLISESKSLNDNIAHELRSPLTRIRGAAELALANGSAPPQQRDMAASVIEECDNLLGLINSMLAIAEMESGVAKIETAPVDCANLVKDTCELFQPAAEDRGIVLEVKLGDSLPVIQGDQPRLKRALANLLDNAIKYTPPNGNITVSVSRENGKVLLTIADTGVGIPKEDLPHIFDRFYRVDRSRSQPGNGLGLGLARAIVRAHGGNIDVTSAVGVGSTCRIALPSSEYPIASATQT